MNDATTLLLQSSAKGGQRLAEQELGWNRGTIRKSQHELKHGIVCLDAFSLRGRKRGEEHLPNLLRDITTIVDGQSQADPQFRTNRLYTCLTAKKLPETDAIFAKVKQVNEEADAHAQTLRISLDAKATVKVGPFARAGKSRIPTQAADHDFQPKATVTPVGLFLPAFDEVFFYGVTSKVTNDCLVDCLIDWWEATRERFSHITTLVINLDNGPENHSRRTLFMQHLVEFVQQYHMDIRESLPLRCGSSLLRSLPLPSESKPLAQRSPLIGHKLWNSSQKFMPVYCILLRSFKNPISFLASHWL